MVCDAYRGAWAFFYYFGTVILAFGGVAIAFLAIGSFAGGISSTVEGLRNPPPKSAGVGACETTVGEGSSSDGGEGGDGVHALTGDDLEGNTTGERFFEVAGENRKKDVTRKGESWLGSGAMERDR